MEKPVRLEDILGIEDDVSDASADVDHLLAVNAVRRGEGRRSVPQADIGEILGVERGTVRRHELRMVDSVDGSPEEVTREMIRDAVDRLREVEARRRRIYTTVRIQRDVTIADVARALGVSPATVIRRGLDGLDLARRRAVERESTYRATLRRISA